MKPIEHMQDVADRICAAHRLPAVRVERGRTRGAMLDRKERRVVVGRHVLALAPDQRAAVIGHELAHLRLGRRRYCVPMLLGMLAVQFILLALFVLIAASLAPIATLWQVSALCAALIAWAVQLTLSLALAGQIEEIVCDWLGSRMTRNPGATFSALSALNEYQPPRWTPLSSHPPLRWRIALAQVHASLRR
jgi:Zn-dependent protease with chaperone function